MSTETTPAAPKASASVFHEEIVLIAEKLGELHDRFERIESEHVEQRVPLDAAKSAQDAALAALTAALQGMKALNFHVLDNNLGAVSKRVEAVEKTTAEKDAELAAGIQKVATALTQVEQVFRRDLSAIAEQKTELGRKVESDKQEAAQHALKLIHSIAAIREDLDAKIEQAKTQFSTPAALNPRGDWLPSVTYQRLDVVTLNGTSYVSRATTKEKPRPDSPDWQILARRGGMSAQAGGGVSDVTGLAGMGATGLQIAQAGTPEEVRVIVGVDDFEGATSVLDGEAGRVPQPLAGDQNKYLRADGTWTTPSSVTAPAASQATVNTGTEDAEYVSPLTLHGYINPRLAALAPAAYVALDGASANRASGIAVPGARGNLAGFPGAVTAWALVRVPESNPAAIISVIHTTASASTQFDVNNVQCFVLTTGLLRLQALGAGASDYRRLEYAGFLAAYAGRLVLLEIAWPEGDTTTDPTIYADGVDITASFSLTTNGTPPNWFDSALVGTNHITGYNWVAGRAPLGAFGFGSFTPAERALFVRTGIPPAWWMAGGSAVALTTVSAFTGTPTNPVNVFPSWVRLNAKFRVNVSAITPDGGQFFIRNVNTGAPYTAAITAPGSYVFELANTSGVQYAWIGGGAGRTVDFTITQDGAITHPAPLRDTLMSADATTLGNVPSRIVGGSVVSTEAPVPVPLTIDYAYTGSSINLLGGVVLPAGTVWEVVSVSGTSNASVNLSIGTSTGGTQIVNAQAITAAPFRVGTYASQIINATAATGLWLTASGNVSGRISIQLRKV